MRLLRQAWPQPALIGCLLVGTALSAFAGLPAPTTLTTTPFNSNKYQISWTPPSGATSSTVTIRRYTDTGSISAIFQIRTSGNSITPVFPTGGLWEISITSRNSNEESAPLSTLLPITIPAPTQSPSGVTVQNLDGRANLRWNPLGDGYAMRLSWTDPTTNAPQVLITKGTFIALRGLANGVSYPISLAWQNDTGIGPPTTVTITPVSNRISATVTPTATPIGPTSTLLSWNPTPNATFYAVYTGTADDFQAQRHAGLPRIITTTSVLLTNVSDHHYAFVLAGNMNGLGPAPTSGTQLAVLNAVTQAPTVSLNPGSQSLMVSWTTVPGATSYAIFFMPTPFAKANATRLTAETSPTTITNLLNGQSYGVAVLGVNGAGDGPLSDVQIATPAAPYLGYQAIGVDLPNGPPFRGPGIELNNGLVLFPASNKFSNQPNAAYLFNPSTETWTPTAPFPSESYYDVNGGDPHRTIKLQDGRVLAVSNPRYQRPAVFDPTTQTWTKTGPLMPPGANPNDTAVRVPGYDFALALLPDGRVLLAGGRLLHRTDTIPVERAFVWSPVTNQWTETAPMLGDGRYGHALVTLPNGKILMVGGNPGSDYGASYYAQHPCPHPLPNNECSFAVPSTQLFDPVSMTWTVSGEMINNRHSHTVTLLPDGDVLAFGGYISGGGNMDGIGTYTAERWNHITGTWSAVGSMPFVQENANWDNFMSMRYRGPVIKSLPDGKVLWISDKAPFHPDSGLPDELTFVLFDPATNLWTQSTAPTSQSPFQCNYIQIIPDFGLCDPDNYVDHGSVLTVLSNGKVIVTGGKDVPRLYN